MSIAVGRKLRTFDPSDDGYMKYLSFHCPGCKESHTVRVNPVSIGWAWNGSGDEPTFSPSIKVTGKERLTEEEYQKAMRGEKIEKKDAVCHSYVTNGTIHFLSDCTHELAGQVVILPDWPVD